MRPRPSTSPASKTHVFPGITQHTLENLRKQSDGNYLLQLDPDGAGGLLTTPTGMGDVVVRFDHNVERAELTVTIVKKPMLLSTAVILTETSEALRRAAGPTKSPATAKPVGGD
jgi:hypothetical protein